jgi:hypothetical protein
MPSRSILIDNTIEQNTTKIWTTIKREGIFEQSITERPILELRNLE